MKQHIWIVDDDESMRWVLERAFREQQWDVRLFSGAQEVLDALQFTAHESNAYDNESHSLETGGSDLEIIATAAVPPDVLLTDVKMPDMSGMQLLAAINAQRPQLPVIVMTAHSDLESAVSAFKGGAFEYLAKPFDLDDVIEVAQRAYVLQRGSAGDSVPGRDSLPEGELIGEAAAMQDVFRAIGKLSRSNVSVLITGPSGSGKELVARALHKHSSRAERDFVALNMAAIPAELIESELFGHERGAFTGATQKRDGRFSQAHGGTLFLDEIGDMPLPVQTRLLRVLAEGQFYPVGSHRLVKVDVRILAATHQDLQKAVADGRFREDLYHRLNVIHLRLPPLAERREDIPALARHFLQKAARELDTKPKQLTAAAETALRQASWPGNIRQLENTCRRLVVMAPGDEIRVQDLPHDLETQGGEQLMADDTDEDWVKPLEIALEKAFGTEKNGAFSAFESRFNHTAIKIALNSTGGHRQRAAKLLGWGRNTLTRKLNP